MRRREASKPTNHARFSSDSKARCPWHPRRRRGGAAPPRRRRQSAGGSRPLRVGDGALHRDQRVRRVPGPVHVPGGRRGVPGVGGGAPPRGGRGGGVRDQDEGGDAVRAQRAEAVLPRRRRRPRPRHQHQRAEPRRRRGRRGDGDHGGERRDAGGADRRRGGRRPRAAALAVLAGRHRRRPPLHRRARELGVGEWLRRARVRERHEDRHAGAGERGVREGPRARRRRPGAGRRQGVARGARGHFPGYSKTAADVQEVGGVPALRRRRPGGTSRRLRRRARVRRHPLVPRPWQGRVPDRRPRSQQHAGRWRLRFRRLPGHPNARHPGQKARRGRPGSDRECRRQVPRGVDDELHPRSPQLRPDEERPAARRVPRHGGGRLPEPHPVVGILPRRRRRRPPHRLPVGSPRRARHVLLPVRHQRAAVQGGGLHPRRAAAARPQPGRALRRGALRRRPHALRQGVGGAPRQAGGQRRLRPHLLPEPRPGDAASARGRGGGGRADGAAQVRRRPALGQEPERGVRGRRRQVRRRARRGVHEGEAGVRPRGALLQRVERQGARRRRRRRRERGEGRVRAGGAVRVLGGRALLAGEGIPLPAGKGVQGGQGVPACRRRSLGTRRVYLWPCNV
uniref:Non-ribosomal peptide synthetase modules and related proteins-like n=1 Tax=Oryza sativa subsp. japonica TaxID=39947 RepID=Q6Z707_ORYSJ|nr:Non-ribosomal peptide synthetase modules and related proteins-like [Oryza sativa Japonica Group]